MAIQSAGCLIFKVLNSCETGQGGSIVNVMARIRPTPLKRFFLGLLSTCALACSQYEPLDSVGHLREQYAEKIDEKPAEQIQVPFELSTEIETYLSERLKPAPREVVRVEQIVDFIFRKLELKYSLLPTRNAVETYSAREGNCLSFVNLFVGVGRHQRMNPFYVEVVDHQRWRHQNGMVLSQGHIVAGMYVNGELRTFDFLPYRPKSYRQFNPIDDITASAHYYNNLAAESLMDSDLESATEYLRLATELAPKFEKALNNLGVARARTGDWQGALDAYERGLVTAPGNVPILTNMARLYQERGDLAKATEMLSQIEDVQTTNPFYFVYRGELALARGNAEDALDFMRTALKLDSEIPEVHVGLAKTYLALGDVPKARHHVERALRLDATHREARGMAVMLAERPTPEAQ